MKINVELDLTTDEAKELFIPSEKQAELGSQIYEKWLESVHKNIMELYNPMNYVKDEDKRSSFK
jgi:hypothetical protein